MMRAMKYLVLLFSLVCILISSCDSSTPIIIPSITAEIEVPVAIVTSTLESAKTTSPAKTPVFEPTYTLEQSDEPGLIVTLSGGGHADLGIPIFSTNGKVVALIGAIIRLWDVNSHEMIRELRNPFGGVCFVRNVKFSPDSNLFAVSLQSCDGIDGISAGRVLVWDLNTGNLLQEWKQETAKMPPTSSDGGNYTIPVSAMAFLPNDNIVFANGNALEIRDVSQSEKYDILELGQEMYASQISMLPDGVSISVLMHWMKTNDLPEFWAEQYKLQVWNINTHTMLREIKYPDNWNELRLTLLDTSLVEANLQTETSQIIHLETDDEVKVMPFCSGRGFYNADGSLLVCARVIDNEQSIELWDTDSLKKIYTFVPDFEEDWLYSMTGIVFSPDNTTLAIAHNDQISLWNISPHVPP